MRSSEPDPATAWPAVADIADRVSGGSASAEEFARAALQRATREDERLRAFREVWPEHAVRVARQIDAAVVRGATFPLAGVPIAVKAWGGTTSAIADRLIAAGCVPLGATSVPGPGTDYQTWGSTERGPTRNPWCPDRVPGGSSAGSAAAVAAGIVPLATGGDSAGSIRIPAAWCGVLGMKPTNAWLPTRRGDGLGALGPLAANAGDLATVLDVLFPRQEGRFTRALSTETPRSAVWSPTLGFAATDADIAYSAARRLAAIGRVALRRDPEVELIDPARAWMALRRRRPDTAAGAEHAEIERRLRQVFERVELILTPTTPCEPHGHDGPGDRVGTELTWTFNLTGHPALSLPAGFTASGLPVGLQVVARRHHDHLLPSAADAG